MKLIYRQPYTNRIIDIKDTPDIKIITGNRRSGIFSQNLSGILTMRSSQRCQRSEELNLGYSYGEKH